MQADAALLPGFADPVLDSQGCFRALLDAMARPGTIRTIGRAAPHPPAPLDPATAAVLLTLLDAEAPVWLHPGMMPVLPWLRFHCGAVAVAPGAARIAVAAAMPDLGALDAGSDLAPEDGATLVLQLPALEGGLTRRLRGPGIDGEAVLRARGLPEDFDARWAANHATYPRGVDLVLCAGERLCALPRSVRIAAGEDAGAAPAPRRGEG